MKKFVVLILAVACVLNAFGCSKQTPERVQTIEGNLKTYYEMDDGTWECDGQIYKYRLAINGTMPNAKTSSIFTYLSNIENISFEQAYKAAGFSSNMNDYFSVEEAVLVDWPLTDFEYGEAYMPTDEYHFHAKVLEIHDKYMLVEHLPDGKTLPADIIEVPLEEKTSWPIPTVGDNVEVYYDGTIMETYPARLSNVYRVEILIIKLTN